MVLLIEEYMEDCKKDSVLKTYDDKLRSRLERITKNAGAGGIAVDQLKEVISSVCEMNKCISDQLIRAEDDIVKLMAGEAECLKLVDQYFSSSSEMLDFCCDLERFVVSARNSHSYISYVIGQLQTDYEIHEDVDNGGRKRNHAWDLNSRTSYMRIVDVLEKLKTSDMVSGNDSVESLRRSIDSLLKKFSDINEALKRYNDKLGKKLKGISTWKRITSMIFMGSIVCVGILAVLAMTAFVAAIVVQPHVAVSVVVVAKVMIMPLGVGYHWASSLFNQAEIKIQNQQAVGKSMQVGATTAIKELRDIEFLIDQLLVHIDSILKKGKFGMDMEEEFSIGFAMKAIKDDLGIFLEKIKELDEEQKKCTMEIRQARDDVLAKIKKANQ